MKEKETKEEERRARIAQSWQAEVVMVEKSSDVRD